MKERVRIELPETPDVTELNKELDEELKFAAKVQKEAVYSLGADVTYLNLRVESLERDRRKREHNSRFISAVIVGIYLGVCLCLIGLSFLSKREQLNKHRIELSFDEND